MAGPSTDDLLRLVPTNLDAVGVQPFLSLAEHVVDSELSDKGLTEERLSLIKLWLAAHFLSLRERERKSEKIGAAEDVYTSIPLGEGLRATSFGQHAIILDSSGTLRGMSSTRNASFELVSKQGTNDGI